MTNDALSYSVTPFVHIRRDLHEIPEIGFQENKTQAYLLDYMNSLSGKHIEVKTWKTGILVRVQGLEPKKTIGYRTDIDGLPVSEESGLSFPSKHEGMMHACGHDFHMSIALGVLTYFSQNQPQDNLLFVFQPAEEGPGGAKPMLESEEFLAWKPDQMIALHIAPELPVGTIATKTGLLFANTSELFIDLKGKGGHAAYPHQANDMVVAASHFVTQLQAIVARNVSPLDSAVVTIGKITGGTKQNIIAENARLEGTIRTLSIEAMERIKSRIENIARGIEESFECNTWIDYGANYCQVYNSEELTESFIHFAKNSPHVTFQSCEKAMTGEDFGYFLEEIPGFMFWLGVESEHGLHSSKLNPNEEAIGCAIRLLIDYLKSE
ncbi:N-acetyldiaminopimelate deacetylase [Evansella cellulosilytica]|uniref:N-acetyldiaminopimelate deacetylase n=1 Tax=Evansella cellulosilytica (strain ATCC 21833 / DSM 2522 / FERM P-1141 / JCM 9156 / N-4) TaxID=649639 RepID=E6TUP6_EVAC2|nr:N-acetyldiaminopimelate deacetylase [Evansella cellulosilytica]ADU30936.1 amidohydrolase [Evansella cellulosilytica DSM 2522]